MEYTIPVKMLLIEKISIYIYGGMLTKHEKGV